MNQNLVSLWKPLLIAFLSVSQLLNLPYTPGFKKHLPPFFIWIFGLKTKDSALFEGGFRFVVKFYNGIHYSTRPATSLHTKKTLTKVLPKHILVAKNALLVQG